MDFIKWFNSIQYWEDDPMIISTTKDGGIVLSDYNCYITVEGKTVEELQKKWEHENKWEHET